jgi:HPt (histidine-containing phosphotransfer) domain-containing protein
LYTIHVHALKSASANIGADALSAAAKALEAAGEQNNTGFIETHNNAFLADLELLLDRINNALLLYNKSTSDETAGIDLETIKPSLVLLQTAIKDLDAGTVNETIEKLQELTKGNAMGNLIGGIFDDILIAEYDKAIESIDALLSEDK